MYLNVVIVAQWVLKLVEEQFLEANDVLDVTKQLLHVVIG